MTFHPLGLSFPIPHSLPFLLLRRICGAHVALFTGSFTFELPSSGTLTFSGLIPVILTLSSRQGLTVQPQITRIPSAVTVTSWGPVLGRRGLPWVMGVQDCSGPGASVLEEKKQPL